MRHRLRQWTVRPHVGTGHASGAKAVHEAEHWSIRRGMVAIKSRFPPGDKAEVPAKQSTADQQIVINQLLQQARTGW